MKKTLLSACAAALALSACQKISTPTPAPTPPAVSVVAPVIPSKAPLATETPVTPPAAAVDELALPVDGRGDVDHVARAHQLQNDGDWPGALAEARRALTENPSDEEALILIGRLGKKTHNLKLSALAYGRLGSLETEDAAPLIQQARTLVDQHAFSEAIAVALRAEERDPQNPEIFQVMGRAYMGQKDLGQAIAHFERVVALQPDHGYALNNLGLAYLHANQNTKAVEVLAKATEQLPNVAYVLNNYGVALERTGKIEAAREAYRQAGDLAPRYVKAAINAQRLNNVADATPDAPDNSTEGSRDATDDATTPSDTAQPGDGAAVDPAP